MAEPTGPRLSAENPWPGLAAYDEAARDYFQGRKEEAAELLRLVRQSRQTALYGKSGLGKSSLLMAGLFPLLRDEHFLPVYLRLNVSTAGCTPPNVQIMDALVAALRDAKAEFSPPAEGETAWHYLHRTDLELWSADNYPLTPVLVFDQFEELFAPRPADAPTVESVMNLLGDLIESRISDELTGEGADRGDLKRIDLQRLRYRVLVSFREDYLGPMKAWERRIPSLLRHYLDLKPMAHAKAVQAVAGPGAAVLEEGVAEAIVDFVGALDTRPPGVHGGAAPVVDGAIEPVLLSLCCHQLNMRRAPGTRIDRKLVEKAGQDILNDFYRDALKGLPPTVAVFIEDELVQGDRYRAGYPFELALNEKRITREDLRTLTDKHRLLRVDPQGGVARIELIHDRLVGVVVAARNERRAAVLARRAEEDRLAALAAAEHDRQQRERDAERQHAQQLAEADASSARKQRNAMAVFMLLAVLLVGFAYRQWDRANDESAKARALATVAQEKAALALANEMAAKRAKEDADTARFDAEESARAAAESGLLAKEEAEKARHAEARARWAEQRMKGSFVSATSTRLAAQSQALFSGARQGGEHLALQQLAAAHRLDPANTEVAQLMLSTLRERLQLARTLDTGAETQALAYSPDGSRVAIGGGDGVLRLFDARSGRLLNPPSPTPPGATPDDDESSALLSVAFSPDGRWIATGGADSLVRLWDGRRGTPVGEPLEGHEDVVNALAFAPDGKHLASTGDDYTVRLWELAGARALKVSAPLSKEYLRSIAYSPDGSRLALTGVDGQIRLLDPATLEVSSTLPGTPRGGINALAWRADGKRLLSGGEDGLLRVWDPTSSGQPQQFGGHDGPIVSVAWQPGSELIASSGEDRTVRLWNAGGSSRRQTDIFRGQHSFVRTLAFSPDGQHLASAGDDRTLRMWHTRAQSGVFSAHRSSPVPLQALSFDATGQRLIAATADGRALIFQAATGVVDLRVNPTRAETTPRPVALSPDGSRMVLAGRNGALQEWSLPDLRRLGAEFGSHGRNVRAVTYAADTKLVLTGADDGIVRIWSTSNGRLLAQTAPANGGVSALAVSADGEQFAAGLVTGQVRRYATVTAKALGEPWRGTGTAGAEGAQQVETVLYATDGRRLAWGDRGGVLRLHDLRTGQARTIAAHEAPVSALAFRRDGQLASGSWDRSIRIWDSASGKPIGVPLKGHISFVTALAFSPDGKVLASASRDRSVRQWPAYELWGKLVCDKMSLDLGRKRWAELVSPELPYDKPCPGLPDDDAPAPPRPAAARAPR